MTGRKEPYPEAIAAGWNPDYGPPEEGHSPFVEALATSDNLDDLIDPETGEIKDQS